MKITFTLLLLIFMVISSFGQTSSLGKKQKVSSVSFQANPTMAFDTDYPLYINHLDFTDTKKYVALNDGIVSRIENTIKEYYTRECDGDSLLSMSAISSRVYFNTLQFRDSVHTLYLLLLRHEPTGVLNGKVLFYDNASKTFAPKTFDFNLHALYDFEDGDLVPGNLKKKFRIQGPEIDPIDYDHDGTMDYRFIRLVHNGTYNALQTTIFSFHQLKVETLSFLESKL